MRQHKRSCLQASRLFDQIDTAPNIAETPYRPRDLDDCRLQHTEQWREGHAVLMTVEQFKAKFVLAGV